MVNQKNHDQHFLKNFQNNLFSKPYTSLGFQLNVENGKKILNQIVNNSINKNHYNTAIWELINYREDNNPSQGVPIKEGEIFRIGRQILKLKYLNVKNRKRAISKLPDFDNQNQFYSVRNLDKLDSLRDLPSELNNTLQCRICLEEESEANRFHNFCICHKNMPTHLICL